MASPVLMKVPTGHNNDLADDLLAHMLECDRCLDPLDCHCGIFEALSSQIADLGGAQKPALYAI
jgi:hypothetical protein